MCMSLCFLLCCWSCILLDDGLDLWWWLGLCYCCDMFLVVIVFLMFVLSVIVVC